MAPALKVPIKPTVRTPSADDQRIITTLKAGTRIDVKFYASLRPITDQDWKIPFRFSDDLEPNVQQR